jgi:hypothetical protein
MMLDQGPERSLEKALALVRRHAQEQGLVEVVRFR